MSDLGNKEIMARNIRRYMEIYEKTRQDMCKALDVKYTTFTDWINAKTYPRIDKIERMAQFFGITKSDLVEDNHTPDYSNIRPITTKRFPVLSSIACGEPILMQEERELYIDSASDICADFVLIAKGDSMKNARIYDGDYVFIRRQPTVENGEIAAVGIGDEATLKRVFWYANKSVLVLRAENPDYSDMEYSGQSLNDVHIFGKAVAFQGDVK